MPAAPSPAAPDRMATLSAALDALAGVLSDPASTAVPPRLPFDQRGERPPPDRDQRRLVFARDGHACALCGHRRGRCPDTACRCQDDPRLVLDHVLPFSRGGCSHAHNLRVLCGPCNRERSDHVRPGDPVRRQLPVTWCCDECYRVRGVPDGEPDWLAVCEERHCPPVPAYCGACGVTSPTCPLATS